MLSDTTTSRHAQLLGRLNLVKWAQWLAVTVSLAVFGYAVALPSGQGNNDTISGDGMLAAITFLWILLSMFLAIAFGQIVTQL